MDALKDQFGPVEKNKAEVEKKIQKQKSVISSKVFISLILSFVTKFV